MKSRFFTIVWLILLICIPVLAYIDDRNVIHNKSMAVPMLVLYILLVCCRLLEIYYRNNGK